MQAKAELTRPTGNEFVRSALSPDGWNVSYATGESATTRPPASGEDQNHQRRNFEVSLHPRLIWI